jgi:hypothetical protein
MIRQSPVIVPWNDLAQETCRIREVADDLRPIFYSFSQDNVQGVRGSG